MKQLLKREAEAQKEDADGDATIAAADKAGNSGGSIAPWFADALLQRAGGELSAWASKNRGGFVVATLDEVPSASAGVRKVLGAKAAKARLIKDAKSGDSMGAKVRVVVVVADVGRYVVWCCRCGACPVGRKCSNGVDVGERVMCWLADSMFVASTLSSFYHCRKYVVMIYTYCGKTVIIMFLLQELWQGFRPHFRR